MDGVGAVRYLFKRVVTCVLRGCVIDEAKHTPKALVQVNPEHYCRTLGLPSRVRATSGSLIEDLGDKVWICMVDVAKKSRTGQGKGGGVIHKVGHTFAQVIHRVLYKT